MEQDILLKQLHDMTAAHLKTVRSFQCLPEETLNYRPSENAWSILECIEHLVRYGEFYIPEISKRIKVSNYGTTKFFKSGLLGNYFAEMMLPKQGMKKMKTFKSMNPSGVKLDVSVLTIFAEQLEELLDILSKAALTNLNRTRTAISISKWVKLRLGDTLRVVIYHNDRHIVQARNVLESSKTIQMAVD